MFAFVRALTPAPFDPPRRSVGFILVLHSLVLLYEEPTLLRLFGTEYEDYRRRVGRWLPRS